MLFRNARLILPDRLTARGDLRLRAGRIQALAPEGLPPQEGEEVVDLHGALLAPGFIDLHVHGALRRDTMEASPEAFQTICQYHAQGGTTALAPTTVTATSEEILAVLRTVQTLRREPPRGARLLGVHVEGPYFSRAKPGAHPLELIRQPDPAEYGDWLAWAEDISQMTLAPELPGALPLIQELGRRGIIASAGHSDAWDHEAAEAFAAGLRKVTHTFNCMSTRRREGPYRLGGLLEFALSEPEIICEVIADGRHVSPTLLRMLFQAKGPDRLVLVTDAAGGAGLAEGETFHLGSIEGVVAEEVALTADRSALCSSTATMIRLVRNMVHIAGASLVESVRMASLNPAAVLGLEAEMGSLAVGKQADLVVLSPDLQVLSTWVEGRPVYRAA